MKSIFETPVKPGLSHTESAIKVYHTKEYSRFNMINGNRQIVEVTVKKIMRDIESGLDVLRFCPIIVEEKKGKLDIIDGQHRFFVARKLKSPVWYIIAEPFEMTDIAKINSNSSGWKPKDFIHSYIQQNNENYKTLQAFLDEYNLPLSVSMGLLRDGFIGASPSGRDDIGSPRDDFQKGKFIVKELATAQLVARLAYQFADFPGFKTGNFIIALCKILVSNVCDIVELVEKYKKDPSRLEKQRNTKEYLTNLENIYNIGAHKRRVIF